MGVLTSSGSLGWKLEGKLFQQKKTGSEVGWLVVSHHLVKSMALTWPKGAFEK